MSIYKEQLRNAFPYFAITSANTARVISRALMEPSTRFPNGASFAVTTDVPSGKRKVYMSKVACMIVSEWVAGTVSDLEIISTELE